MYHMKNKFTEEQVIAIEDAQIEIESLYTKQDQVFDDLCVKLGIGPEADDGSKEFLSFHDRLHDFVFNHFGSIANLENHFKT